MSDLQSATNYILDFFCHLCLVGFTMLLTFDANIFKMVDLFCQFATFFQQPGRNLKWIIATWETLAQSLVNNPNTL